MNVIRYAATAGALCLAAGTLGACGSDSPDTESGSVESTSAVTFANAWARTSPEMTTDGAVYFDVTAAESDSIVGASVDSSVAAEAQVHEVTMASDDSAAGEMEMDGSSDNDDMAGMSSTMTMSEVDSLLLPAGETISFVPGSFHLMLIDLADPLVAGDTFDVIIHFEHAVDQTVAIEVKDSAS